MGESQNARLRVGVVGLGRLWESRHKPSLLRLKDRFRVTAVYDQVHRRARTEAANLNCVACEGLTSLVARPDVDVVYLLCPQWFGLHPAGLACDAKKPVYCGLPLAASPEELEQLARRVDESGVAFMPEFARRCYPATLRLKELLATSLGEPRLILGQSRLLGFDRYAVPGPTTQLAPAPLLVDPGSYLLDWCCFLMGALPESVIGTKAQVIPAAEARGSDPDFVSLLAAFPGGASAQVSFARYDRGRWGEASRFLPASGFQVFAERGAAWLELPERIQWSDASGTHEERLPMEPTVGDALNEQFYRLVHGEPSPAPTIRDAVRVAGLVREIERSLSEGRVIGLAEPSR
ncbi:Putative 4,5-dihydroxyphthalate dehydrogenase [Aquisphaera giovannonii]|uniref:4,5-dihydroxyphthalate dehydrogenase n=1 Tax=Aquisphaera giovannonii TaxID=406548 RepID=A0A5B9VZF9_9BACT|nr:Gfo/Idh/MocA family oxidoreductase [Aquisphaera giovannonii]QEH33361.1 Putative 4,5-dihydroxyphthalate dehydrogenase [Aquisphaera giovannonii]